MDKEVRARRVIIAGGAVAFSGRGRSIFVLMLKANNNRCCIAA